MDEPAKRKEILELFKEGYGAEKAVTQLQNWRLFNMACSELFAYNGGNEWYVEHYLFSKTK
jgi:cyclopropane-fatty-acyl-phospholipid synthase